MRVILNMYNSEREIFNRTANIKKRVHSRFKSSTSIVETTVPNTNDKTNTTSELHYLSLVAFNNAFNTIRLYKRQGCVTDRCPVRESQD